MISFDMLTTEELKYICDQVPLSAARQYFQKNPKAFAEIRPGFRPDRLSASETASILLKNANKPFIKDFLSKTVSIWLLQIEENQSRLVDEGYSEEESLLLTIPDSFFCNRCELYFKLVEKDPSEDYLRLFREALFLLNKEADVENGKEELEEAQKNEELLTEYNKTIIALREQLSEREMAEANLTDELNKANKQLKVQCEELESLERTIREGDAVRDEMQTELDRYRHLASYSDEYTQDEESEFQHISIGQVFHDYNGQTWISRLADIIKGEIVPFVLDENALRYFGNRDRLFWRNGPEEDGSIGVWRWRADQNYSDPSKDYVISEYSRHLRFTEVVELPQCKNLSEVTSVLTNWFEKNFSWEKVLFVYKTVSGALEGVLCSPGNIEISSGKARLLPSVFMLPHYTIKQSDVIKVGALRIYCRMSLGIPQSIHRVRTPYDVVKRMLLQRITIPSLRELELTKKEAQKCKHYLETIPTETLIQELADAYACTEDEAKAYIDGFVEHADTYLSENDFDMNIISLALARNTALIEVCKKQLSEEWEKEYSERLEETYKQLESAKQDVTKARRETEKLIQERLTLTEEIQKEQQRIKDFNQLAIDVERKVTDRIMDTQQNAAEFVSQMTFLMPFINSSGVNTGAKSHEIMTFFKSAMEHEEMGSVDDLDTLEEELIENLEVIGYSDEVAVEMAQAVSFCICSRLPVVIGENATSIAQCIAATIGGEELTEVFLGGCPSLIQDLYKKMCENHSEYPLVYLIHGVFDGYNVNLFNELTNLLRKPMINATVILSLQGISSHMIVDRIWSNAFYIDGDIGLERITNGSVHSVRPKMPFTRIIDNNEYKNSRKELQPFSALLSNLQMSWYARYLASYGVRLNDSPVIINQIITVCRSKGLEDNLNTLFHENGISTGEKMLEQNL